MGLNRSFTQRQRRMANEHMERCSTALVIREMQVETAVRFHYTPITMAKNKNYSTKWW